jgi:hypothetical protein
VNTASWYRRIRIARMQSARLDFLLLALQLLGIAALAGIVVFALSGCADTTTLQLGAEGYALDDGGGTGLGDSALDGEAAEDTGGRILIDAAEGSAERDTGAEVDATGALDEGDAAPDNTSDAGCTTYTSRVVNGLDEPVDLPSQWYVQPSSGLGYDEGTPISCLCVETYNCACIVPAGKAMYPDNSCLMNVTGCSVDGMGVVVVECGG